MEVKTVKFKLYPNEEPTGYAVGFHITANNKTIYRDLPISFSEVPNKTDEEIVQYAWSKIKESLNLDELKAKQSSSVLGKTFTINDENDLEEVGAVETASEPVIEPDPVIEPESPMEEQG